MAQQEEVIIGPTAPITANRLTMWLSIAGLAIVLMGGMMTLYFQVTTAYNTANELQKRVDRLSAEVADDKVEITKLTAQQIEIDTQLRSSIDGYNHSLAWQLRIDAMLWQKSFKSTFPTDNALYTNIADGKSQ